VGAALAREGGTAVDDADAGIRRDAVVDAGQSPAERPLGAFDHVGACAENGIGHYRRALDAEPFALERELAQRAVTENDARRLKTGERQVRLVVIHRATHPKTSSTRGWRIQRAPSTRRRTSRWWSSGPSARASFASSP